MNIFIIVFAAIIFKIILALRKTFRTLVSLAGRKNTKRNTRKPVKSFANGKRRARTATAWPILKGLRSPADHRLLRCHV